MPEPLCTLLSYKTFSPLFFAEISLVISLGFMGSPSSPATPIPCMHYVGGFFSALGVLIPWPDISTLWSIFKFTKSFFL